MPFRIGQETLSGINVVVFSSMPNNSKGTGASLASDRNEP